MVSRLAHDVAAGASSCLSCRVSALGRSSFLQALEGVADPAGSSRTPRSRVLSASPAAAEKVKELTKTMQEEGADSKRTLEKVKSIGSLSLSRGLDNVSGLDKAVAACD